MKKRQIENRKPPCSSCRPPCLLLGGAAFLPAVVIKDVAVRALPPRVRLVPNPHVRQVSAGMVVCVKDNVVYRDNAGHSNHDYARGDDVRERESTERLVGSLHGEQGCQMGLRSSGDRHSLALYFFHWNVSALASSGLPLIMRRPAARRLRDTNERPNIDAR